VNTTGVYHEGELDVQRRAGESRQGRRNGSVIRDRIVGEAKPFLARLPYAFAASLDASGQPWAHLLIGEAGFARTGDGRRVHLDLARMFLDESDPFRSRAARDRRVGLLFLELESRRRLRVNGSARREQDEIVVAVAEAYPNCPKYIQRRSIVGGIARREGGAVRTGSVLPTEWRALIREADSLFVASAHPERGADASHRGGAPGFVRVLDERTLEIPDYPGNSMFNTLGNLTVALRAGLLFVDFEGGRTLQLTGAVEIRWNGTEALARTGGTGRLWRFHVAGWRAARPPARLRWEYLDASPFNPVPAEPAPIRNRQESPR